MKKHIGVKILEHAEPMTHGEFVKIKYPESPLETDFSKINVNTDGYLVQYEGGYISWSPKEVFEKAYFPLGETYKPNSVCQDDVDKFIKSVSSIKQGEKTTVTTVTLVNGFEIIEASSSADKCNFDMKLGEEICLGKIKDKIWYLLGFLLNSGLNGFK